LTGWIGKLLVEVEHPSKLYFGEGGAGCADGDDQHKCRSKKNDNTLESLHFSSSFSVCIHGSNTTC
jgi:hypothetical protein